MPSEEPSRAFEAALKLLSYRPRAEAELRRRLSQRFSGSAIDGALSALRMRGLVDDLAFAHYWREARREHRPRGEAALRWELRRLGVDRDVVEEALQGLHEEEEALKAATLAVTRWQSLDYSSFYRKMGAYLQRRGFRGGVVRETVRRMWERLSHPVDASEDGEEQQQ